MSDEQYEEQELEVDEELEPTYECDYEYPCNCLNNGVEGEWSWYPTDNLWRCAGCGETQ